MSSDGKIWFSALELGMLGTVKVIPGMPRSDRGARETVKRLGWPQRNVECQGGKNGLRTEYQPPADVLALIHPFLEANPDFFKVKRGAHPVHTVREPAPKPYIDGDFIEIDNYVNVRGSAGPGAEIFDEAIVKVRVDARLLRERIGSNFSRIKIASVSGDSMEPTLSHGDQVLVDTSCNRFVDDAIYAIQQDGHLRFKRISLNLDGSIEVKSDATPRIETYSAEVAQNFKVIGMIIPFKFGRFKV